MRAIIEYYVVDRGKSGAFLSGGEFAGAARSLFEKFYSDALERIRNWISIRMNQEGKVD